MVPTEKPVVPPSAPRRAAFAPGAWIAVGLILLAVGLLWLADGPKAIPYSGFKALAQSGQLKKVTLLGKDQLTGEVRDKTTDKVKDLGITDGKFTVSLPPTENVLAFAKDLETWNNDYWAKVQKDTQADPPDPLVISADEPVLQNAGPMLLTVVLLAVFVAAFVFFVIPRIREPGGSGFLNSYVRSPAKRYDKGRNRVTFEDVAGMDAAKRELHEIVEFLRSPDKFTRLGAQVPKGVLLVGPPGTGKTMLAKAVAGEANVPFYSINGSEFIQMFVGVGASRVRDLFKTAKENAPCVIFIDEIDAVGRMRGAGVGGGSDEREQTLNQILGEMDGFLPNEQVIVLAATNRPDVLDAALLRPGRFDRHITVDRPTWQGRLAILKVHTKTKPLADTVDLEKIARNMIGMSGADLRNLCNEAALLASRAGKPAVEHEDFDTASDRVRLGAKREEVLGDDEKKRTAVHEAGHALCAFLEPKADPIDRVSIIPRGRTGGVTLFRPDEDKIDASKSELSARLVVILGGRAADRLVFGEQMTGEVGDLKQATRLARMMVTQFGMSDRLGPVSYRVGEDHVFLGKELAESRDFSEGTARIIDEEVQSILAEAESRAGDLLAKHKADLDHLAATLLQHEELDREQVERALKRLPVYAPAPPTPPPSPAPVPVEDETPIPARAPNLAFGGA
ncbi:MAG TPA: ATP-dependent zinc metalloprotease FtsH [Fimbriiglobus sp.]